MRYRWILIFILPILLFTSCSEKNTKSIQIKDGVLDLTQWDINKDGIIQLDGNWDFYWKQLLSYSDIQKVHPDIYGNVPSAWNDYTINENRLSGEGYATYRLHIKTSLNEDTMLGLRVYALSSAYNIYINEKLIGTNGHVGTSSNEEVGEYRPQAIFFNIPTSEFDIIVQISNFEYARGGFWYTMYLGSSAGILDLHDSIMGKEIFLLGALTIISLFYLTMFILRREFKYSLYFACFCISAILALDMVGQYILVKFLPGLGLKYVILLWYSSTIWVLFFLILYVHELFKSAFSLFVMKIYLLVSVLTQILLIFTSSTFYTRVAHISNVLDIIGILCAVIIVAIGIKNGQQDGWLNIASMVLVLITYIHDDLYWTNVITNSFGELVYSGLFIFIFIQMFIQARRIKLFHVQQVAAELSFLQAQIKPHFLYNAINTFISISRYDVDKARSLLINFGNYLRSSFDFKDLSQFVTLKNEIELVKAYIEIEEARFEERLEVNLEVCDVLNVNVPILMLQPVVENAVIHGVLPKTEGGRVDISIRNIDKYLVFSIKDNGVGLESKKVDKILKYKNGSGIGLSNIDARLKKLYKKGLHIESKVGIGTEVTWCIPINKRSEI